MLLLKEGTTIFSDFGGIIQKRFKANVSELQADIRKDLTAAGILGQEPTDWNPSPARRWPLGNAAAARVRLIVWCKDCRHQIEPDPAEMAQLYGPATTVLDWSAWLAHPRWPGGRGLGVEEKPLTSPAPGVANQCSGCLFPSGSLVCSSPNARRSW
jgi:hypothetical protein